MFAIFLVWVSVTTWIVMWLRDKDFQQNKPLSHAILIAMVWPLWLFMLIFVAVTIGIVNLIAPLLAWTGVFDR